MEKTSSENPSTTRHQRLRLVRFNIHPFHVSCEHPALPPAAYFLPRSTSLCSSRKAQGIIIWISSLPCGGSLCLIRIREPKVEGHDSLCGSVHSPADREIKPYQNLRPKSQQAVPLSHTYSNSQVDRAVRRNLCFDDLVCILPSHLLESLQCLCDLGGELNKGIMYQ